MDTEIKPSFSIKYLFLIILSSLITGGITFSFYYIRETKDVKKINLVVLGGTNELEYYKVDNNVISVKYSLKNDTSEVNGYFRKYINITNIGTIGIESLECKVITKDTNIVLLPNPKTDVYPALTNEIDYKIEYLSKNKQCITIPLLNKKESINFNYEAYSKVPIKSLDLDVIIRQKDLEVTKSDIYLIKEEVKIWPKILIGSLSILGGLICYLIFGTVYFRKKWNNDINIREKYNNKFWTYWWKGK